MEVMDQRRNEIVEFVNENQTVTFTQLKEKFPSVSEMTLRTDLKYLDQAKRIVRIHGGAKSMDVVSGNDDVLKLRYGRNVNEKKEIAQKALSFVEPAKTIFVDSGSTTTMLVHVLNDQNNIFYTSGLTCAIEMAKLSKSKVFVTGGNLNMRSFSVNGMDGLRCLEKVNFDVAFIGVTRYAKDTGFTCESLEDCELKRKAIERSKKVIVLMDSSKVERKGTYTICGLDQVDVLISDSLLSDSFKQECEKRGLSVY